MKKSVITVLILFFSISICEAQNLQDAIRQQQQQEAQQRQAAEERRRREAQAAEEQRVREEQQRKAAEEQRVLEEQQRQAAEEKRKRDLEVNYQSAIANAESSFNQRQFAAAKQGYLNALELKPENAAFINARIAEVDRRMNEPATLYIYRKAPAGTILAAIARHEIYLDNVVVGTAQNRWKTTVSVTTFGNKTLSGTIEGRRATLNINFEPGGVYYVRASYSSRSVGTGKYSTYTDRNGKTQSREETTTEYTPTLQLVDRSIGKSEFDAVVPRR